MKNTKTKIILSAIILLLVVGLVETVNAVGASLYVSPASSTKTVGNTFDVSIRVNSAGTKICAVEGTLVFNNLSCQSITVASDATPQSAPSCSNTHFLIGIPSCTTADKILFTVSAKAGNTGAASISFTGVDIIGEGVSAGSTSVSGNYTINAVSKPTTTPTSTLTLTTTPTSTPKPTPKPKLTLTSTTTPTPTPTLTAEVITPETEQQPIVIPAETPVVVGPNFLLASFSNLITLGTENNILGIIVLFAIALIIYLTYSYFAKKKKTANK